MRTNNKLQQTVHKRSEMEFTETHIENVDGTEVALLRSWVDFGTGKVNLHVPSPDSYN
jgi:hypothetical protein